MPPEEQATSLYFDEIWSEVALYILGQRRELRQETLEAVFRHSDAKIDDLFLKLLSGRLLQAAWHSTEAVKEFGVEKALSYAPALRDALLRGTEKLRDQIPEILLDFVVLLASGDSFRSSFLQKSAKRLVDKLQSDAGEASIYQRLALLWTQREVLSNAERR